MTGHCASTYEWNILEQGVKQKNKKQKKKKGKEQKDFLFLAIDPTLRIFLSQNFKLV